MASNPANTQITVQRTVRSRVVPGRFSSIKEHSQKLGPKEVMAPGEEIDVILKLDNDGSDAPGPNPAWRFGMPVSVVRRTRATPATIFNNVSGLDLPKRLVGNYNDVFIQKTEANATDDLHQEVRDASPAPRGLHELV